MANTFSDQLTKLLRTSTQQLPQSNEIQGKTVCWRWSITLAAQAAINDVIMLVKLPRAMRVLLGREYHSAMTTGGAAATGEIGTYQVLAGSLTGFDPGAVITTPYYQVATTYDAAGQNQFADTIATGAGQEVSAVVVGTQDGVLVGCKVTVEAFAAAGTYSGFFLGAYA